MSTLLAAPPLAQDVCDDVSCREATSHPAVCECACDGEGHGVRAQAERASGAVKFQARPDVRAGGFTNAMVAQLDDGPF